jgi:hypothetical protein
MRKDSLLFQSTTDYDPNKMPTVVLHHQGESHAGKRCSNPLDKTSCMVLTICLVNAASGYIINGLENNIAAGNGLRGIRWLRVNTL